MRNVALFGSHSFSVRRSLSRRVCYYFVLCTRRAAALGGAACGLNTVHRATQIAAGHARIGPRHRTKIELAQFARNRRTVHRTVAGGTLHALFSLVSVFTTRLPGNKPLVTGPYCIRQGLL